MQTAVNLGLFVIVITFFWESSYGDGPRLFPNFALLVLGACASILFQLKPASPIVVLAVDGALVAAQVTAFRWWRKSLERLPPIDEVLVALPFSGRWFCAHGGPSEAVNHHYATSAQRYAFDFCGNSLLARLVLLIFRRNDFFKAYNQPIISPVEGTVVNAVDGCPEGRPPVPQVFGSEVAGNHVVIHTPHGFLWLAHLRPGSVRVKRGDQVAVGEPIGACGNSGRSTEPHLHIHLQNTPDLLNGDGIPIAFRTHGGRVWRPLRGDYVDARR